MGNSIYFSSGGRITISQRKASPCVGLKFMASVLGGPGWKWEWGSCFPNLKHFWDTESQPIPVYLQLGWMTFGLFAV